MCNKVHKEPKNKFKKIPEKGTGWKLFRDDREYALCGLFSGFYREYYDGWIIWDDDHTYNDEGYGFCFFPTLKQAERALSYLKKMSLETYKDGVVMEIEYEGGLGSFLSSEMDSLVRRFCIAKKFRVKDEE